MPQKKITYKQMHEDLMEMITPADNEMLQKKLEQFLNSDGIEGIEEESPEDEKHILATWEKISTYRKKMSEES